MIIDFCVSSVILRFKENISKYFLTNCDKKVRRLLVFTAK